MIEVKNLVKKYGNNVVLNNVSLKVKKKKITAIVGLNGSGKSTLLDIICGVKPFDSGQVLVDGKDIKTNFDYKYEFGYVPQNFSLFLDLTVRENIEYIANVFGVESKEKIDDVLSTCFLSEKQNYLSSNLSGGYKQLLSLACALISRPKILILDEPTSAMDPIYRNKFWKIISYFNKNGNTVLVSSHYLEEISKADEICLLSKNGKILKIEKSELENRTIDEIYLKEANKK